MTRIFPALVTTLTLFFTPAFADPLKVAAKVWPHPENGRFFPELDDPDFAYPRLKGFREKKERFGIAFSGGGTRAASATLGQLRTLNNLGWLDKVDYISSVSGGSWTTVPFLFLPENGGVSPEDFLGKYHAPGDIVDSELKDPNHGTHVHAIANTPITAKILKSWATFQFDDSYSNVLNKIFLKPYELDDRGKFFVSHKAALLKTLEENPHLSRDDFYVQRSGTPFHIAGGTLQKKHQVLKFGRQARDIYPLEMTGLYVGVSSNMWAYAPDRYRIGGGYLQSFAYDSGNPSRVEGREFVNLEIKNERHRFTLSDTIAVSGAAPQIVLTGGLRYLTFGIFSNIGLPEMNHWPITDEEAITPQHKEFTHGDGGNIENSGLMPLLARGVNNVIVFSNSKTPLFDEKSPPGKVTSIRELDDRALDGSIRSAFTFNHKRPHNHTFDERYLVDVYNAFVECKLKNQPLVYCGTLPYRANPRHGIKAGTVRICWYYLDKNEDWLGQIVSGGSKYGRKIQKKSFLYKRFPHYKTSMEQPLQFIDLSHAQSGTLAHLTAWSLLESSGKIRNHLKVPLP